MTLRKFALLALATCNLLDLTSCNNWDLFGNFDNPLDPRGTAHYEYATKVLAGLSLGGALPDNGANATATGAQYGALEKVAWGPDGTVYLVDSDNNRIVSVKNNVVQTVAGTGKSGFSGDGGAATSAELAHPTDVVVAPDGTLYIADGENNRIRRVKDGTIDTIIYQFAVGTETTQIYPTDLGMTSTGKLYVTGSGKSLLSWEAGELSVIFSTGYGSNRPYISDGLDITTDADGYQHMIVDPTADAVYFFAYDYSNGSLYQFFKIDQVQKKYVLFPLSGSGGITFYWSDISANGQVYLMGNDHYLYTATASGSFWSVTKGPEASKFYAGFRVNASGTAVYGCNDRSVRTMAGTTESLIVKGYVPQLTEPAMSVVLPDEVVVAADGSVYFSESKFSMIRKLSADHTTITVVAGTGVASETGLSNGLASSTALWEPTALAIDSRGNPVFVSHQSYFCTVANGNLSYQNIGPTGNGNVSIIAGSSTAVGYDSVKDRLYFRYGSALWQFTPATGNTIRYAGIAASTVTENNGDEGLALNAEIPGQSVNTLIATKVSGFESGSLFLPVASYTTTSNSSGGTTYTDKGTGIRAITPDGKIHAYAGFGNDLNDFVVAKTSNQIRAYYVAEDHLGGLLFSSWRVIRLIDPDGYYREVFADRNGGGNEPITTGVFSTDSLGSIFAPVDSALVEYENLNQ